MYMGLDWQSSLLYLGLALTGALVVLLLMRLGSWLSLKIVMSNLKRLDDITSETETDKLKKQNKKLQNQLNIQNYSDFDYEKFLDSITAVENKEGKIEIQFDKTDLEILLQYVNYTRNSMPYLKLTEALGARAAEAVEVEFDPEQPSYVEDHGRRIEGGIDFGSGIGTLTEEELAALRSWRTPRSYAKSELLHNTHEGFEWDNILNPEPLEGTTGHPPMDLLPSTADLSAVPSFMHSGSQNHLPTVIQGGVLPSSFELPDDFRIEDYVSEGIEKLGENADSAYFEPEFAGWLKEGLYDMKDAEAWSATGMRYMTVAAKSKLLSINAEYVDKLKQDLLLYADIPDVIFHIVNTEPAMQMRFIKLMKTLQKKIEDTWRRQNEKPVITNLAAQRFYAKPEFQDWLYEGLERGIDKEVWLNKALTLIEGRGVEKLSSVSSKDQFVKWLQDAGVKDPLDIIGYVMRDPVAGQWLENVWYLFKERQMCHSSSSNRTLPGISEFIAHRNVKAQGGGEYMP